jgi:choline dehydrogenase-like flavoprotein
MPGFGADLKDALRDPGPWRMFLRGFGETLPRHENHCYLDPDQTDEWGIPSLRVSVEYTENVPAMEADIETAGAEILESAGVKNISFGRQPYQMPGIGNHEMGSARMGRDPKTSVLNAHNQAHDVPNLFVTDGACMTSSACQNPSLTYMALSARAAHFAADELAKGNL